MKFVKGMIVGGIVSASILMAYTETMGKDSKKMMKKGKQMMKKMGIF